MNPEDLYTLWTADQLLNCCFGGKLLHVTNVIKIHSPFSKSASRSYENADSDTLSTQRLARRLQSSSTACSPATVERDHMPLLSGVCPSTALPSRQACSPHMCLNSAVEHRALRVLRCCFNSVCESLCTLHVCLRSRFRGWSYSPRILRFPLVNLPLVTFLFVN